MSLKKTKYIWIVVVFCFSFILTYLFFQLDILTSFKSNIKPNNVHMSMDSVKADNTFEKMELETNLKMANPSSSANDMMNNSKQDDYITQSFENKNPEISYNSNYDPSENRLSNPIFYDNGISFYYHNNYATSVFLKSSFDDWKMKYPFSKKISSRGIWDGWWELKLDNKFEQFQLKKGKYYYKLVVDDNLIADPNNMYFEDDEIGNKISYFVLEKDIINYNIQDNPTKVLDTENQYRFVFKRSQVNHVYLVGNFNNWNPYSLPLIKKNSNIWEIVLELPPGEYYYNFIVDDKWIKDPLNTKIINNMLGQAYSYFEVKKK